jgi:hypothetical protein
MKTPITTKVKGLAIDTDLKGWSKFKLGDLSEKITKGTTPSTIGEKFLDSGINYIKSEAFRRVRLQFMS